MGDHRDTADQNAEGSASQRKPENPDGAGAANQQAREDGRVISPAGTHAKPSLTDHEKTPGAGTLPEETANEADPGAG